jgi:hypothetical protein
MTDNKITLIMIVNGISTEVEANTNAPLQAAVNHALSATKNTGQPADRWEVRDANGNLLDQAQKIGAFGFPAGAKLFLNLHAGVGG